VDSSTGGWGHINLDQIVESDASLTTGIIVPTNQFINFPVKLTNSYHVVALLVNGWQFRNSTSPSAPRRIMTFMLSWIYPPTKIRRWWSGGCTNGLHFRISSYQCPGDDRAIYQEALRPIYHFTPRRGFNNDPNGMVYFNGEYHLCYQHNPYDVIVGNQIGQCRQHGSGALAELPEAIYGDALGQAWSGSSVVI